MPLKKGKAPGRAKTASVQSALEDLRSEAPEVRRKAAVTLEAEASACEAVAKQLEVEEDERVLSALALAVLRTPSMVGAEALFSIMRGNNASKRSVAVDTLRSLPDQCSSFILDFLDDADADVRVLIANILQFAAIPDAAPILAGKLENEEDENVLGAMVDALLEIGSPHELPALEALHLRVDGDGFLAFALEAAIDTIRNRGEL